MSALHDLLFIPKWTRHISRKVLFRCWVAGWLCVLALIIGPVEHSAGQAPFLAIILVFIKPPSDPTIIFILQSILGSVVLAMIWAWCVLAEKLSYIARDHARDNSTALALAGRIHQQNPSLNQTEIQAQVLVHVFDGSFLQKGPSVIWAVFLFIGIYFVFLIRVYHVRLFFVMVFCVILLSISSTIGPLVPQFYAVELSRIYLVPHCYYLATALFAALFICPTSVAETVNETLRAQSSTLRDIVASSSPSKLSNLTPEQTNALLQGHLAARTGVIGQFDTIGLISPYLAKEISVGQASGVDVRKGVTLLRRFTLDIAAISVFLRHINQRRALESPITATTLLQDRQEDDSSSSAIKPPTSSSPTTVAVIAEHIYGPTESLLTTLTETTSPRHRALVTGLTALASFYDRQTGIGAGLTAFFFRRATSKTRSDEGLADLQNALDGLKVDGVFAVGLGHGILHDRQRGEEEMGEASFVHELFDTFITVATQDLAALLRHAIKIEGQHHQIWWPGRQNHKSHGPSLPTGEMDQEKKSRRSSSERDLDESESEANTQGGEEGQGQGGIQTMFRGTGTIPPGEDNPSAIAGMSVPDSRAAPVSDGPAEAPKMSVGHRVYKAIQWFGGTESGFALKISVLAIALACPAWIKDNGTAKFYYEEKGLWALVAGLTAKGVYSSETTFGFIQRVLGAVSGATVALVVWYISTGNGNGNAYGLAATCAVVLIYSMAHRIWHSNFLLTITATTTGSIVLGYSWADVTDPLPFNPGVGYSVYWKRLLLVLVGLIGTWIIDLLPRPKTGRKDLQRTYVKTTQAMGDIASRLITRIKSAPSISSGEGIRSPFSQEIGVQTMSINSKLRLSTVRILLAKLEPSLHREWNAKHYIELQRLQFEVLDLLGVIAVVSEHMDARTRTKLVNSPVFAPQQTTLLLNLFYITSTSLDIQRAPSHQIPTLDQIRHISDNLDIQLNALVGDERARAFLITSGAWIELCKCVEQLAKHCQTMFGTAMPHGA